MRTRRRALALLAGAAMTVATVLVLVPGVRAAVVSGPGAVVLVACNAPAWAEGTSYQVGQQVTYNGRLYQALVAHTPPPGAGWNPAATPALWKDLGACDGGGSPTPTASPTRTASPTASPTRTASPSPSPTPTGSGSPTCAAKSRPAGKVL